MFPIGLTDHIDILKDGASAIYGTDAVAGVLNVFLKHKFRGLELNVSYGNASLGASDDQGEERTYLLAGTGDDHTDIVTGGQFRKRVGEEFYQLVVEGVMNTRPVENHRSNGFFDIDFEHIY